MLSLVSRAVSNTDDNLFYAIVGKYMQSDYTAGDFIMDNIAVIIVAIAVMILLAAMLAKSKHTNNKLAESTDVIGGLAGGYTAIYHVNLDTGRYVPYHIAGRTENIRPYYERCPKFVDLAKAFADSSLVRPEDSKALHAFYPSDEEVRTALKDKKKISMLFKRNYGGEFLWTQLDIIKCERDKEEAHNIIVGFVEMDEEVRLREAKLRKDEDAHRLVENIAAKYSVAYTVNMATNEFNLLKLDRKISHKFDSFTCFSEAKTALANILHEDDRERIMREMDFGTIREKIQRTKSYYLEYRTCIAGITKWQEMNITFVHANEVAMGFAEKDLEIIKRRIEDKRYGELFALFEVDLDTEMIKIIKNEQHYKAIPVGTSAPYTAFIQDLAAVLDEEPKAFFNRLSNMDYVKQELAVDDKRTYTYKSSLIPGDKWVDVTAFVILRHDDGTPAMFTLGFSLVDAVANARQELARRMKEDMQMIGGLASGYNALYYLNIDEDTLKIYALDETKYPGSRAIFEGQKKDFIKIIGGYGLSDQVHPDDRHLFEDFNPEGIRRKLTGRKKYSMRFRAATASGYRWDEMELIKNEDIDEQANAVAVGFTDRDSEIRREQEYQQQLEETRIAAENANRAKTNFLFSMSHDIRTPMNAITGFTNMAIKHIDNKDRTLDCLDKIQKSGNMLLSLINSVLEVSRIEAGHATLEQQHGDVTYSFSNIEHTMQELAKTKDINLTFEFGDIRDRYVYVDFSRCMRIFVNVISNAIKYTLEGGFVKVHCEQVGEAKDGYGTYKYTVTDNGIGMSEEFQKHVFDQFARERTATVSGIQGTGLGMSVVKSFVELMGGTISLKSKQGEGTTFTILLPFKLQEGEKYTDPVSGELVGSEEIKADTTETVILTGKKLLLVEDNDLNREIAIELLQEEGLLVEEAEDGSIAVDMLKKKGNDYYDFILMDVQMPIMDGYEATRQIRAGGFTRPIIALSANAFAEDKAASLAAGMNDHVAKPINMKILMETLRKWI